MKRQPFAAKPGRWVKPALTALSVTLSALFTGLGAVLILAPGASEGLATGGLDPGVRALLGAAHVAAGIALLIPRLAGRAALALGVFGIAIALRPLPDGEAMTTYGVALMAFGLVFLGACLISRDHAHVAAWDRLLASCADREESRRAGKT